MTPEIHIAGLFVQVFPALSASVSEALRPLPGVELRGGDEHKLVVVCEANSGEEIVALIDRMRELNGVINVVLVYQHIESASELEEMIDGHHPAGLH